MMGQPIQEMNLATSCVLNEVYNAFLQEIELSEDFNADSYKLLDAFNQINSNSNEGCDLQLDNE